VKRFLLVAAAAAAALVASCFVYTGVAQQAGPAGPPSPGLTVLLDVNALIKENEHLKAMMAEMQRDVTRAEEVFRKERDAIRQLADELKEIRAGTPQYREKEEEITKRTSDLNVKIQLQRKEFLQRESKIYYTVYQEIQQEVDYFAANNNIAMVLKTTSEPVDVEKPEDILREMNKPVVWNAKALDITPYIRARLQQRYGTARTANPAGPPVRQGVPFPR